MTVLAEGETRRGQRGHWWLRDEGGESVAEVVDSKAMPEQRSLLAASHLMLVLPADCHGRREHSVGATRVARTGALLIALALVTSTIGIAQAEA